MRLTRQIPALIATGLSVALIASAATTTATAVPRVKPVRDGLWITVLPQCPLPNGKVESIANNDLKYRKATIYVTVTVSGHVTDDAVLGTKLVVEIKLHSAKFFKDIDIDENVSTKANGAPGFSYKINFTKSTTTSIRKEVAAEVADAMSRARKQEAVGRDDLLVAQKKYWGKPGKCVKATLSPNHLTVSPAQSGTTAGSLSSAVDRGLITGNWRLVKAYVGKLDNANQKRQLSPNFRWTAAGADVAGDLVKVTLRATSKEGLDDVTFTAFLRRRVHVEMDLAYVRTWPAYPDNSWDLSSFKFGAILAFDATEKPGLPGVYALDSDANWSFPVQSAELSPSQDCVSTSISYLGTSAYGLPRTAPDHPKGDYDVIQQEPDGQWRMTPFLYFTAMTVETPPTTNPYNCKLGELFSENMRGIVDVPPGYRASDNFLDTFIPNGKVGETKTVEWTRDLANLDQPLGFGDGHLTVRVNVTQLPTP